MTHESTDGPGAGEAIRTLESDEVRIDRFDTGMRLLFTVLFFVIVRVVETVLLVAVGFELLYALVTEREPSHEVRRFARRALDYLVEIGRYVTYNQTEPPFPFAPFPDR